MNLTPRWVPFLTSAEHQAVHWSAVGPAKAKDSQLFEYALQNRFVLLTNDLDFMRLYGSAATNTGATLRG
jgi:predicted nuclease of predicted toxin-antitoxin system